MDKTGFGLKYPTNQSRNESIKIFKRRKIGINFSLEFFFFFFCFC